MKTRTHMSLVVALLAALLAALGTAVISTAQDDASQPSARDHVKDKYKSLRRAQQSEDKLPDGVRARFGAANASGPKVDEKSARRFAKIGRDEVFVARGAGSVCSINVNDAGWAGGCTTDGRATRDEPQVSFDLVEAPDGNDYRVWGIAPDTIRELELILPGGGRMGVPLIDGAFSVTSDEPAAAVAWTTVDGVAGMQPALQPPTQG